MDLFIPRGLIINFLFHRCVYFCQFIHSWQKFFCLFLLGCLFISPVSAEPFTLSPDILQKAEQKYGSEAKQRLLSWQDLINNNLQGHTDLEKLALTNQFFNKIPYKPDQDVWNQPHYWATPVEFLSINAGDCEEFAIAKYYTLLKLGVPHDKLRLAYVKAVQLKQAHMVVTYYETPQQEPLILDSLRNVILYASERPDLIPVYSFNAEGMWMTPTLNQSTEQKVGTSNRMRVWLDLQQRMEQDGLK